MAVADVLCPELLDKIFSFLPTQDLCAAAQVCSNWKEITKLTLRRRMSFKKYHESGSSLRLRDFESYSPIELLRPSSYLRNTLSESELAELELGDDLQVVVESHHGLALLAISAMKCEWREQIKKVYFETHVQIEDWSVVSGIIIGQFPVLEELRFKKWAWFDPAVQDFGIYGKMGIELRRSESDKDSSLAPELEPRSILKIRSTEKSSTWSNTLDAVIQAMKPEWCEKIVTLLIESKVAIEHFNLVGASFLRMFPRLKGLSVQFVWLPQKYNFEEGKQPEMSTGGTTDEDDYEYYGKLVLQAPESTILESKVGEQDFVGKLVIEATKEDDGNLLVHAFSALKSEMCDKITDMEFRGDVAVEDWNVLETSALGRFRNLKEIRIEKLVMFNAKEKRWERCGELLFSVQPRGSEAELKLQGTLNIRVNGECRWNEPILAAMALNDQWSSTLTKLKFVNEVAVQDWNVVGKFVTDKFSSLEELKLKLRWVPGYEATVEIEGGQVLSISNDLEEEELLDPTEAPGDEENEFKTVDVEQLKFEQTQAFQALKSMNVESCTKITHLRLQNELAVQDWNVAGIQVLSKFPNLQKLQLNLVFVPDYVSTIETGNFPSDAVFENLEKLEIKLEDSPNQEPFDAREPLRGDLVTRCPNLKVVNFSFGNYGTCACRCGTNFFVQYSSDTSVIYIHAGKAHVFFGRGSDESDALLCSTSRDVSVAVGTALAPVLNSLPFTSLRLDEGYASSNLYFVKHLSPETTQLLTTFETQLSSECESASKQLQFLFTLLHRQNCYSLENLTLLGGGDSKSHDLECDAWSELHLPTVKKLKIGLEASYDYDELFFAHLTNALPNVEELLAFTDTRSEIFGGFSRDYLVRSGKFLKYSAAFKQLKVLEWQWKDAGFKYVPADMDFFEAGIENCAFGMDCLVEIENNLTKHEALESLKVSLPQYLNDEQTLEAWKAVVRGCAAAPRMRSLKAVYTGGLEDEPLSLELWFNRLTTPDAGESSGLRLEIVEKW